MLQGSFFSRLRALRSAQTNAPELPFTEVLTADSLRELLAELKVEFRVRVFTPLVTLWVFLAQVLDGDASCRQALTRLLAFRVRRGLSRCSTASGSYCEARQKLPEALLQRLVQRTGREVQAHAAAAGLWHGRRLKLVDGTTVSMPDTAANVAAFDKPRNQRGPAPFPVARLVVLMCGATCAALEASFGRCRGKGTGELSLFRTLLSSLEAGEIVVADRLYCAYCDIVQLGAQGVDVVLRLSASRSADFRRGKRLGPHDHLVTWRKSAIGWMSRAQYAAVPETITLREVRVLIDVPGFRARSLVIVTTLLDPAECPREEIAALFRQRWQVEVQLRSLKSVLHLDVLRCKTPDMVRKEIWAHLLAYNLLCSLLCSAANDLGCPLTSLSFKAGLQLLLAFRQDLLCAEPDELLTLGAHLLQALGEHRVHDRLNRFEPRKCKRPPKPYPQMKFSRAIERTLCLHRRSG